MKKEAFGMSARTLSFKTPEGQAAYLAAYDANMALWPVPHQSHYIQTSHGVTHVITCGPADAPPVVLLHAYLFSATEWYANVAALAANHRLYVVDVMGDMTQTVQSRPFRKRAETAIWLSELLDALGIERTIMIGHSYGAWLTLNFALHAPERLERMVLLAPAASFMPMVRQFLLRRLAAWLFPVRGVQSFAKWCLAPGNRIPECVVQLMTMAVKHYRYTSMPPMPDVYTDEELRRIETPCLFLVGEREVIYKAADAVERATRLVKGLQAKIIPNASHALNMEQPDKVNEAILPFITADRWGAHALPS